MATKGEVPDGEHVDTLGTAAIRRQGSDLTIAALGLMVPRALEAAEKLQAEHGLSATVIECPFAGAARHSDDFSPKYPRPAGSTRFEENPRLCGLGRRDLELGGRGMVLGFGRADYAHHHAPCALARRRSARGLNHPERGAHRCNHSPDHGLGDTSRSTGRSLVMDVIMPQFGRDRRRRDGRGLA